MRKLTERELLKRLENWREEKYSTFYSRWKDGDEHAYQQIKEMIEDYAEHQELTANYIDIVIDLYDQLEQKKPEVTEEWIEEKAKELSEMSSYYYGSDEEFSIAEPQAESFIRSLVEEINGRKKSQP